MVLAKCGKISNTQVIGSTVTTVLKRLSQLSGKAVTTIMKKLSQLSGKVVTAVMLFALSKSQWGQMGDFRLFERSFHGFGWKMARSLWRVLGYFFFLHLILFEYHLFIPLTSYWVFPNIFCSIIPLITNISYLII